MKIIPSRQLAASPGKVWKTLEEEGTLVISRDGMPKAIMIPTSDTTLIEDVREHVRARARRALTETRKEAAKREPMSDKEISLEIQAARQKRKGRK